MLGTDLCAYKRPAFVSLPTYDKLVTKATNVSKHSKASVRMWKWQNMYYINNISTHFCFRSLSVSSSKVAVRFSHCFILDNIPSLIYRLVCKVR